MNKLVIALVAGYFLGNDKAREELNKFLKNSTSKTIDIINNMKNEDDVENESNKLHASTEEILQEKI